MQTKSKKLTPSTRSSSAHENDGIIALAELRFSERYDNAPDAIKKQIIHEQAYGLFAVLRYAALSTLILSSLSLVSLWSTVPQTTLLIWYALTNAISMMRHLVYHLFKKTRPTGAAINYWLHLVLLGTILITLAWCALVWITWLIQDIHAIAFVAFILAVVAFGSFSGLGLYLNAYVSAAGPLFIALAILFGHLASGSTLLATVSVGSVLIIGMGMLAGSLNATRVWRNTMVLLHEHQALAREHREKSAVLSTTLHSIGDGVLTVDANGLITFINPAAEQLTGCMLQDVIGKTLNASLRLKDEDKEEAEPPLNLDFLCRQVRESMQVPGSLILTNRHGNSNAVEVTISPLYVADDLIDGYVITLHDVTSLRLLTRDLSHQALHDPLTGLLNRRGFEARLQEALERKRTSDIAHSLCYIDLDHFKTINDTHGHKAGDEALQHVVSVMQKYIRDSDSFGRLGGDEFAILLYGCTIEKAEKIVEEICQAVPQRPFIWQQIELSVGVSIGLVPMLTNDSVDNLKHAADSACYEAKSSGRGKVHKNLRV